MLSLSEKIKMLLGLSVAAMPSTSLAGPNQITFPELVCVAGSFGENYGEPGHLLGLGGINPNLIVIQDKTAKFYYLDTYGATKAFQQYRLHQPFDVSFAKTSFAPVTVNGDQRSGDYVTYVGPMISLDAETMSGVTYKGILQIDSRKLMGSFYLENQHSNSSDHGYQMGLLECSKAGVK